MKIVIAEDEGITRQWLTKSIEGFKGAYYVSGSFSNGLLALDYCLANKVDVLITDIQMPVMDGLTMVGKLRKEKPEIQVIVLSAYDQFAYARQAIRLGVCEFILKPEITRQSLEECLIRIEEMLKAHQPAEDGMADPALLTLEQKSCILKLLEHQGGQSAVSAEQELNRLSVRLSEKRLFVIMFQTSSDEQKVLEMSSLLLQSSAEAGVCYHDNKNIYVVIANADIKDAVKFSDELFRVLQIHTDEHIYMGFSRVKDGYGYLPDLFRQAVIAFDFCVFFKADSWRYYDQLSQNAVLSAAHVLLAKENETIQSSIRSGAYEEAFKKTAVMLSRIGEEQIFPPSAVKSLLIELLAMFIQELRTHDLTKDEAAFLASIDLSQASEKQTLDDLKAWWLVSAQELIDIFKNKNKVYSATIQNMIVYINNHYARNITLDGLARHVNLNRSYVSTLFKKETGEHLSDYILKLRIEKACHLLRYSSQNITAVSEDCGFTEIAYFSRVFKRSRGLTPSAYRERVQQEVK